MTAFSFPKKILIIATALVAMLLLVSYGMAIPGRIIMAANGETAEQTESKTLNKTLNVSGQSTVYASPDIAYINLGVVTESTDKNAKTAQQENAEKMSKIIAAIKAMGIKSEDIKTINYSIYPKYNYIRDSGLSEIVGYSVNNTVQVTVRDISKVGEIVDRAAQNDLNISSSISFGLSNYEKYYNEALKNAVQIAKTRANTIAEAMGISLKEPVTITESGGFEPIPLYDRYYPEMKVADSAMTPIEGGSISIRASVSIVYTY